MAAPHRWHAPLAEALAATGTPGAVLGVLHEGRTTVVPAGVLSTRTGTPVLAESVFQIGSITKPWVGLQVSQAVDEGRLALDATVADVLPGVRLGDPDVAGRVTVQHLLTHTSGLDGDVFVDTGRGDDAVARYVELLHDVLVLHEPGAAYSYCNSGFVLLGRMLEVVDGRPWEETLQRRVAAPLGLEDVCLLPEEALLRSAAVGHHDGVPVTAWQLPRSVGPAGLVTTSAASLLRFAGQWLGEVGPALARAVEPLVPIPDAPELDAVGWAWRVGRWGGHRVLGHSGETMGQTALLRVVPDLGLAVCVLTNDDHADAVQQAVVPSVVADLAPGVEVPPPPAPDLQARPSGLARHVGAYARRAAHYEVSLRENGDGEVLWLEARPAGDLVDRTEVTCLPLLPRDDSGDRFVRRESDTEPWSTVTFTTLPDGTPHLFSSGRVAVRVP